MEIEGKSLRRRVIGSVVVFVVLLAYESLQDSYDLVFLAAVPVLFFVFMIVIDAGRRRAIE